MAGLCGAENRDTWLFAAATTSGSAVRCNRVVRAESRAAAAGGKDRRALAGNPSTQQAKWRPRVLKQLYNILFVHGDLTPTACSVFDLVSV